MTRSSDVNPIENMFHLIRRQLTKDSLQYKITKETSEQFSNRVKNTIHLFLISPINKTIEIMNKRM